MISQVKFEPNCWYKEKWNNLHNKKKSSNQKAESVIFPWLYRGKN